MNSRHDRPLSLLAIHFTRYWKCGGPIGAVVIHSWPLQPRTGSFHQLLQLDPATAAAAAAPTDQQSGQVHFTTSLGGLL